ncbi:hypothetical protein C4588_03345 [Candidatus Parcubacteria bacterium]|jgi:hypothetical protein|nr:MAG: hypothetical protein C4588_03345 [Candidatus Parcubacteria bacterium]
MTDDQIERLIEWEIKRKGVIFQDMINLPGHGVDPNPEDKLTPNSMKDIRSNRFETMMGCDRMKELLCREKFSAYQCLQPLKIPMNDLFRFWWNRCVERECVLDEILEDIFDYFTERMRPPSKKPEEMKLRVDFKKLPLFDMDMAA